MGLLDSVIGALGQGGGAGTGGGSAELLGAVIGLLGQGAGGGGGAAGGLGGLVEQFTRGGLGHVVQSWIGTGQNLPVSPEQISQVLGSDTVAQLARQFGLGHGEVAGQLSQLLPQVVDRLTPNGQLPDAGALGGAAGGELGALGDIGGALGNLLRR